MASVTPVTDVPAALLPSRRTSIVALTFPDQGHDILASCASTVNLFQADGDQHIDDVSLRSHFIFGKVFVHDDGQTDHATEQAYCRQRFIQFRGALRKVSLLMAFGTLVPAIEALADARWLRFLLLACVVSPIYVVYTLLTFTKGFAKAKYALNEKIIIALLAVQSIAFNASEWGRAKVDYGMLVMHFSYIHNFTPIGARYMHAITAVLGLGLYLLLKTLRYIYPDKDDDNKASTNDKKLCIQHDDDAEFVIGMIVPLVLLLFQVVVTTKRSNSMRLDLLHQEKQKSQQKLLNHERKASEDLLRSMLPQKIIVSLKRCEPVQPQFFENVTVIFIEICAFDELCAQLEPGLVVEVLNVIFVEFDRLSDLLRVYKVETVGQVYMAVVGCPTPVLNHADVAAHFALACLRGLEGLREEIGRIRLKAAEAPRPGINEAPDTSVIQARAGLNSGRLRAGVVGLDAPRYKLVGDTVNTASRMESTCLPGRVQASPSTLANLTKDMFIIEDRGEIPMKGKGNVRTSFLNGYVDKDRGEREIAINYGDEEEERSGSKVLPKVAKSTTTTSMMSSLEDPEPEEHPWQAEETETGLVSILPSMPSKKQSVFGQSNVMPVGFPVITALKSNAWFSESDMSARNAKARAKSRGNRIIQNVGQFFLFTSPAYQKPEFLEELNTERLNFEEATMQSRIALARNLTVFWLLMLSVVSALDYYLDVVTIDVERYRMALVARIVGNSIFGLGYLLCLASQDLFRMSAQTISFIMLSAQGLGLLASAPLVYNNEPGIIALYSVYVLSYSVCTIFQRLCLCLTAVISLLIIEVLRCDVNSAKKEFTTIIFLVTLVCFIACGIRLEEFMNQVAWHENRRLESRSKDIQALKASGHELLVSLLPSHVVQLVRAGMSPIAEHYDNVTIIFTDIKGFTAYSSKLSPQELMTFLNCMYSAFDEVILNWGLHKVEIIGDAYFISSGCPQHHEAWTPDEAAMRAVEVALALVRTMPQVCTDSSVQMRVGLHTGSVVAGVVGKKGPRYHLFGPNVNYANKMESHGEPSRIHISDATYQTLLEGKHSYEVEERNIEVEGEEGLQKTWFVNRSHCQEAQQVQKGLMMQRRRSSGGTNPAKNRP